MWTGAFLLRRYVCYSRRNQPAKRPNVVNSQRLVFLFGNMRSFRVVLFNEQEAFPASELCTAYLRRQWMDHERVAD